MTTIDYMYLIGYKSNIPTTRIVKFGHLKVKVPRGVCITDMGNQCWSISLKNLKDQFKDIPILSRTARLTSPGSFETAYHAAMVALANTVSYCEADHHKAINTHYSSTIGSYSLYKKYNLPCIRGICLGMVGTTRLRVKCKTTAQFSHAYGGYSKEKVSYISISPHTRKDLIAAIKNHIHFKGSDWANQNANAKEFLKNF